MKTYDVLFKFSDVNIIIRAEDEEEARKRANNLLQSDYNPQNDTYCYDIEVEEQEISDEESKEINEEIEEERGREVAQEMKEQREKSGADLK